MSLKTSLIKDFPKVSTEEWEEKIKVDLKGKDYDRALVWESYESIKVKPYYRAEDTKNLDYLTQASPDRFPFVKASKGNNDWFICQTIIVRDLKLANERMLFIINRGVNSVNLDLSHNPIKTKEEWDVLLKDVMVTCIEVNLKHYSLENFKSFVEYLDWKGIDTKEVYGSICRDPLTNMLVEGYLKYDQLDNVLEALKDLAPRFPKFKFMSVLGSRFNNAGANAVEELAFSIAAMVDYLNLLTERGASLEMVAENTMLEFGVGSNYFMEIAKFRAARVLYAHVIKAFGLKDEYQKLRSRAITSTWNKTIYDPHVNILRTTTEAMSASMAGVDTLIVRPFDCTYAETNPFSERIARNIQILLKEESNLDKVIDPASGSYYVESLTDQLITEAWELFLQVEDEGGFLEAIKKGLVQKHIHGTCKKRREDIRKQKENFLGTNQFPKLDEHINQEISEKLAFYTVPTGARISIEPMDLSRATDCYDNLRLRTERSRTIPKVFLLSHGHVAMRLARSQFATNFMAVAGFHIIDNGAYPSLDDAIQAANDSGAEIVVVCSSDDEYADIAPKVQIGTTAITIVAGNPACRPELEAKGVDRFINVKSNILDTLAGLQRELGI